MPSDPSRVIVEARALTRCFGSLRIWSLPVKAEITRAWASPRSRRVDIANAGAVGRPRCRTRRMRAQAILEVALAFPLLILAGTGVIQFSLWMHAEAVVTAAVQDGARVASSETGTLADGQAVAAALLHDGLGPTADRKST